MTIAGLHHCHSAGVFHRDLKPENVLLDRNLQFRVADFGFAIHSGTYDLLQTTLGTEMYMAPEVRARKQYRGPPADVVRLWMRPLRRVFAFTYDVSCACGLCVRVRVHVRVRVWQLGCLCFDSIKPRLGV